MDWNPSAPDKIGLQWAVRNREGQQPAKSVAAFSSAAAMGMISTDSENITQIRVPLIAQSPTGALTTADLLVAGQEVPAAVTTTIFRPNASDQFGAVWRSNTGATTNLNTFVDEAVLDTSDYVYNADRSFGGFSTTLGFEFDTAGALTGQRIVAARFKMMGMEIPGLGGYGANRFVVLLDTVVLSYGFGRFPIGTPAVALFDTGEYNVKGLALYTVAAIQSMDSSALRLGIRTFYPWAADAYNAEFRLYQIWLEVDSCPENRLVARAGGEGDTQVAWRRSTAAEPDGSAPWNKDGTDFTVLYRQLRQGNVPASPNAPVPAFSMSLLEGFGNLPSSTGLVYYPDVRLEASGVVAELGTPVMDTMFGFHMDPQSTATVDSQDYARVLEIPISAASGTNQQEVSGASAQFYDGVRFPVIMDEGLGDPGTLTVTLKRRSDNATMATATVTRASYDAALVEPVLRQWRMVQVEFAAPAFLAAGTQYYLAFTADGVGQWRLQLLTAYVPQPVPSNITSYLDGTTFGSGTYGGTADMATVEGVDQQYADFSALVYVQPPTPEDFAVVEGEQEVVILDDNDCDDPPEPPGVLFGPGPIL